MGELKIRADKDPFTALVQVLACAAHLATPHQYARLRQFAPSGGFPERDRPVLDGYVLLDRFLEVPQADLERLAEKAEELSSLLMGRNRRSPGRFGGSRASISTSATTATCTALGAGSTTLPEGSCLKLTKLP